jgi:hypothetical protein
MPQQWTLWRRCPCGFDFGPPAPPQASPSPAAPPPPAEPFQLDAAGIRKVRIQIVAFWVLFLALLSTISLDWYPFFIYPIFLVLAFTYRHGSYPPPHPPGLSVRSQWRVTALLIGILLLAFVAPEAAAVLFRILAAAAIGYSIYTDIRFFRSPNDDYARNASSPSGALAP